VLGRLDLDPLPLPEDVVLRISLGIKAGLAAFSPLAPFADCRNWAGLWRLWIGTLVPTLLGLLLTTLTAWDATILRLLGDNELARHRTIRMRMSDSWPVLASL